MKKIDWLRQIYKGTTSAVYLSSKINNENKYVLIKIFSPGYYQKMTQMKTNGIIQWFVVKFNCELDHYGMFKKEQILWEKEGRLLKLDLQYIEQKFNLKKLKKVVLINDLTS